MPAERRPDLPRLVLRGRDTLEDLLDLAQLLVRREPATAGTVARALVAEGRHFATTPEGRHWRSALATSELVRRGRLLWYAGGFDELISGANDPNVLPSDWLAIAADILVGTDLEALLSRRFREGDRDGQRDGRRNRGPTGPRSTSGPREHAGLEEHDVFLHLALGLASLAIALLERLADGAGTDIGPRLPPTPKRELADEPLRGLLR